MGRRQLEPGEAGPTTFRGKHPDTGRWTAEAKLKADRLKAARWQASCRYREPRSRELRIITATDTSKTRAETRLRASVEAIRASAGLDVDRSRETVSSSLLRLLEQLEAGDLGLAPRTVGQYRNILRSKLLSEASLLAELELRDVTTLDVKEELLRIRRSGGEGSVRHARALLNRIFEEAVDAEAIETNPVAGARKLPRQRKAERVYANGSTRSKNRALARAEEGELEEHLGSEAAHVADLILLCMDMGLRISEATSLRWEDVDLERGTIAIVGKLVRVKGQGLVWDPFTKDLRARTLPLRKRARGALERRLEVKEERGWGEYVFITPRGGTPDADNYNTLVRRVFDRAGLRDVTMHTLRRTVERDLELAGATVAEREQFMGHTEAVARKHYADYGQAPMRVAELLE